MLSVSQLQAILSTINQARIGGKTRIVKLSGADIGVTAKSYTAGQVLGTRNPIGMEILTSPNGTAILYSAVIGDLSKSDGAINITFFSDQPVTVMDDGAVLDINDADIPKVLGTYKIIATDYTDFNDNSIATKSGSGFTLENFSTTDANKGKIWVCFTANDSKTYAVADISANLGFLLD